MFARDTSTLLAVIARSNATKQSRLSLRKEAGLRRVSLPPGVPAHDPVARNDAERTAHACHAQIARRAKTAQPFLLRRRANQNDAPRVRSHKRGASRSSRTLAARCDGRVVLSDERHDADGEVVWSWRPWAGVKVIGLDESDDRR